MKKTDAHLTTVTASRNSVTKIVWHFNLANTSLTKQPYGTQKKTILPLSVENVDKCY